MRAADAKVRAADVKAAHVLLADIRRAKAEKIGTYDMQELMREAYPNGKYRDDGRMVPPLRISRKHMDYLHPSVGERSIGNKKARGMFTSAVLPAGTLVHVSKSFAFNCGDFDHRTQTDKADKEAKEEAAKKKKVEEEAKASGATIAELPPDALSPKVRFNPREVFKHPDHGFATSEIMPLVIAELVAQPERASEFYGLTGGTLFPAFEVGGGATVDPRVEVQRIAAIIRCNGFAGTTDLEDVAIQGDVHQDSYGSGLWIRPSFFNHSCMPNCTYTIIGDFIFIFTMKPVEKDEELTFGYWDVRLSFADRTEKFANWNHGDGFVCLCDRCFYCRANPSVVEIEREVDDANKKSRSLLTDRSQLGTAANQAMPRQRRLALISQLKRLPLVAQAALSRLYELEYNHLVDAREFDEALQVGRLQLQLEEKFYGVGVDSDHFVSTSIRIAITAALSDEWDEAEYEVERLYRHMCTGSWGLLTKEGLKALVPRYAPLVGTEQVYLTLLDKVKLKS